MRKCIAILVAACAAVNVNAREIKSDQPVTITGKLGSYTDKEDGFKITITTDDVVVPLTTGTMRYQNLFRLNV